MTEKKIFKPFPKRQILDSPKLKDVADDNFKLDELLVTSNFSFSHSVFKRLVLQTRKKQGLVWERVTFADNNLMLLKY